MQHEEEIIQATSAIYKFVSENPAIHKNVLRKKLLAKGKISSKGKFFVALDRLASSGRVVIEKENVTINEKIVELGVLQKSGDDCYVITPKSNKHYKVSRNVAAGYKSGDLIDIIIEKVGANKHIVVLGLSQKKLEVQSAAQEKSNKVVAQGDNNNLVLGRVVKLSHDELIFIPNKKSFPTRQIPILNNKEECAKFQDKICVMNLVSMDAPLLGGYVVEVKGEAGNPIEEYDAIAESYGAIMSWNGEAIESEIARIPAGVNAEDYSLISEAEAKASQRGHVVDLRHIPFVTVDPATCKDMDDAIYSTFNENGDIVCYIAVANVTKYVDLNSEIGKRYIRGAFTIYAPNKAYNILPTQLSTGVCSLNPNEDRLAFVVKAILDKSTGRVKDSKIYDAIIQSRHKYSYEQAQQIVDELSPAVSKLDLQYKFHIGEPFGDEEQILMNYYAGQTIKVGFDQRKMIRFVSNKEREIVFDQDMQDVVDISPVPHLYYHEVIEAFMVTANEATAKYARDHSLDNIFRVHDEPNPRKIARANEFFEVLGIDFEGELSAEGTRTLIELIRDTANEEVINNFLIKMQSRAIYSNHLYSDKNNDCENDWVGGRISHYALQSPHYSHTTSPIRRLPDYVTQHNILAHIHGTKPISANIIESLVDVANQRQLEVDQAEKDFEDISSVLYCEKHIGERMSGRVTKIRQASPEEGYEDSIIVIAKNEDRGINVEIPLSQVLGRSAFDCQLSEQKCAVFDAKGNVVLTICKPIDFIIERADRKNMLVVGRTNKELMRAAVSKGEVDWRRRHEPTKQSAFAHKREKIDRERRFANKRIHRKIDHEDELSSE